MRSLPLAAALLVLLLLAFPSTVRASGSGSGLALEGPSEAVRAEGPATTTLDILLTLDGVACAGNAEVPVLLDIADSKGLRSAALTWDRVVFRVGPTTASAAPWTGTSQVGVRVWAQDPTGYATVKASYSLPPGCVSTRGPAATTGQATATIHVLGPELLPPPAAPAQVPPLAQRTQEVAYAQESRELAEPIATLPTPVLGAIAGMCLGGIVVLYKRVRGVAG